MKPSRAWALAVVPVRRDSGRLPGKALLAETGRPLFVHTAERAARAALVREVWIATADPEIERAAEAAGFPVRRTPPRTRSGSERCALALRSRAPQPPPDVVLDVQGDWPEIDPADLDALVSALRRTSHPVATLGCPLAGPSDRDDPNVVKVLVRPDGRAHYFTRAPVPGSKEGPSSEPSSVLRHVGVYAFRREALLALPDLPRSRLAAVEGLEQLTWLDTGWPTLVVRAGGRPRGIETADDYRAFAARLRCSES